MYCGSPGATQRPAERADDATFSAFYREFTPTLVAWLIWQGARLPVAADIAQEMMIKAYRNWSTINQPPAWARRAASRAPARRIARIAEDLVGHLDRLSPRQPHTELARAMGVNAHLPPTSCTTTSEHRPPSTVRWRRPPLGCARSPAASRWALLRPSAAWLQTVVDQRQHLLSGTQSGESAEVQTHPVRHPPQLPDSSVPPRFAEQIGHYGADARAGVHPAGREPLSPASISTALPHPELVAAIAE